MVHFARWKIWLISAISVLSLLCAVPSFVDEKTQDQIRKIVPSFIPASSVNLGLDLKGGSHLLLEADIQTVVKQKLDDLQSAVRLEIGKQKIESVTISSIEQGIKLNGAGVITNASSIQSIIRNIQPNMSFTNKDGVIEALLDERGIKDIRDQTMAQSIEIVSRRVNETGTREPVIQRQGEDRILVQLPGLDNPERIKELLGKTAKLTFHLVDLDGVAGADSRTLPLKGEAGQTIPIQRRIIMSGDMLDNAQPSFQDGMPVVSFRLNAIGARRFCDVTTKNVDKPFAVVLDNEVITAPRINEPICGGSAVISGTFTVEESSDLAVLLRAGALPTSLTVMEERSVGPTLGSDSIEAGAIAAMVSLGLIIALMVICYGLFGWFASAALLINLAMTITVMSMIDATLTLPGIAGLVLTIGTTVDANVLIFERMKEEMRSGRTLISAIDAGYRQAMSSIIDSNLTALISGAILYIIGTGPIKGFAVTLTIGILTSLFSAIMLTRMMLVLWLKYSKSKTLPIS
jgi:preprotein translocase subunit SecD